MGNKAGDAWRHPDTMRSRGRAEDQSQRNINLAGIFHNAKAWTPTANAAAALDTSEESRNRGSADEHGWCQCAHGVCHCESPGTSMSVRHSHAPRKIALSFECCQCDGSTPHITYVETKPCSDCYECEKKPFQKYYNNPAGYTASDDIENQLEKSPQQLLQYTLKRPFAALNRKRFAHQSKITEKEKAASFFEMGEEPGHLTNKMRSLSEVCSNCVAHTLVRGPFFSGEERTL